MSWLYYLLEANFYLAVFYLLYYFVLRRETYYQLNRLYLLISSILAFVIPFFQLGILKPDAAEVSTNAIVQILQPTVVKAAPVIAGKDWSMENFCMLAYLLIVSVLFINLVIKIYKLVRLSRNNKNTVIDTYKMVETSDESGAFSFFNYLFISAELSHKQIIIRHELVHVRQKHSWDIMFFEMVKIINWFNPIAYLLQHSIKELHEFIADSETVENGHDTAAYTDFLMNNAYGITDNMLTNTFFNKSLIKKRIIMLHQQRSGKSARLKYLLALPVCAGLLCVSTLGFSKTYGFVILKTKKSTAISDAGKVKTLRTTNGDVIGYGDKITIHGKNYTVDNLTEADMAFVLKTYNIKLEVVEVDGKPVQATLFFPSKTSKDSSNNSTKTVTTYTSKGYKYTENGYLINGKSNFRVLIFEKGGEQKEYFRNPATKATLNLLKVKYGYTFPTIDIYAKLPPPPPAPVVDKRPPLSPPSPQVVDKRPPLPVDKRKVFSSVQQTPEFPGGLNEFGLFLAHTIKYPVAARKENRQGKVFLKFIVERDGSLSHIKVVRGVSEDLDKEAVRAMSMSPKWKAGVQNGKKVRVEYSVPISFTLAK